MAYCWALDTHEWDRLDDVFLPDATASLGRELDGIEAIKERISGALSPLAVSQHIVGTHQVTLDGDRATARCYLHAQHVNQSGGQYIVAGRYDDDAHPHPRRLAHPAPHPHRPLDRRRPRRPRLLIVF